MDFRNRHLITQLRNHQLEIIVIQVLFIRNIVDFLVGGLGIAINHYLLQPRGRQGFHFINCLGNHELMGAARIINYLQMIVHVQTAQTLVVATLEQVNYFVIK